MSFVLVVPEEEFEVEEQFEHPEETQTGYQTDQPKQTFHKQFCRVEWGEKNTFF